jgi:hypothetical protein
LGGARPSADGRSVAVGAGGPAGGSKGDAASVGAAIGRAVYGSLGQ